MSQQPSSSIAEPRPPNAPTFSLPPAIQTPLPMPSNDVLSNNAVETDIDICYADSQSGGDYNDLPEDWWKALDEIEREEIEKWEKKKSSESMTLNQLNQSLSDLPTPAAQSVDLAGQVEIEPEVETARERVNLASEPSGITLAHLRSAAMRSQTRPFFTPFETFNTDAEDDLDDDADGSDCEEDISDFPSRKASREPETPHIGPSAWFKRPKRMSLWLYEYFATVIQPLIATKKGKKCEMPILFSDQSRAFSPPTFWVNPPEPITLLFRYNFNLHALWLPRVYLWIPHHFVKLLCCPQCGTPLEKNGASRPRRIVDLEDNFYIVTWRYYCRAGCKLSLFGWNTALLNSLPSYICLAFPAVLSTRSGVSTRLLRQLRVCNQHKMGPCGYRSLLLENHTHKFNVLQVQYLESIFELTRGRQELASSQTQKTLHAYVSAQYPSFGNFSDPDGYGGFVPGERYLANMMNKAIERDESDANQHTACLAPDQIAIDDSHKVNKHIAKVDGVPVFTALFTCMDSRYIRGQALTLTKSHEERAGTLSQIAKSIHIYGHDYPKVMYSDDPVKDKPLLYNAFPTLFENLTPIAASYGLTPLDLPVDTVIKWLSSWDVTESTLSAIMSPIDITPDNFLCVSLDAEWNLSRKIGVSVLQIALHSPVLPTLDNIIYIIPVHKFGDKLPPSLLRLLISQQVFKIGSSIKGDITRLKKQFPILASQSSFNLIDLKEYCVDRGLIARKAPGSLEALCEAILRKYIPKEQHLRQCEDWESKTLSKDHLEYAARDVYASRMIFECAAKSAPISRPEFTTPSGTPVALHGQEGGDPIAYGIISYNQPTSLGKIRVKTPNRNRLVLDIDTIICPTAAVILHLSSSPSSRKGKTKSGALTLEQIHASSLEPNSSTFKVVAPLSLIEFDWRKHKPDAPSTLNQSKPTSSSTPLVNPPTLDVASKSNESHSELSDAEGDGEVDIIYNSDKELPQDEPNTFVDLDMLEAYSVENEMQELSEVQNLLDPRSSIVSTLQKLIESPPDASSEYTRVKKDIFHAFHMIPTSVTHGARPAFLRAMRDHLMRWDPTVRETVDKACQKHFKLTFEQMLLRNPRFIAERTPRYVPPPSILVPALSLVFETFGNALDVKTGLPLFNADARQKAAAVLDLARQGYLSDIEGVTLYEQAGFDKYGLQKYKCLRGTNNVEGGPHGDIYRKFGALHAGPRLTVNCLTDHRTHYNLQAFARHIFGVDWEYHHDLGMINRTSFLLNYLSDTVEGASSYSEWINSDLYERTEEQFGVCRLPETVRTRLGMEPFTTQSEVQYKLNPSDDWLRRRQGLALPVLPPTTLEARKYFFSKIREFAALASDSGKSRVDFEAFAQEWNRTADGKERVYVTTEVLLAYSKTWERATNIRATQELITDQLGILKSTSNAFSAPDQPFPTYLTGTAISVHPQHGVAEITQDHFEQESVRVPDSLSIQLSLSRPPLPISTRLDLLPINSSTSGATSLTDSAIPTFTTNANDGLSTVNIQVDVPVQQPDVETNTVTERPNKRRRLVPDDQRKRSLRKCRRCLQTSCAGNSNILSCPQVCTVPCRVCQRLDGCRGVDGGRICTWKP